MLRQERRVCTPRLTEHSILWCFKKWDAGPLEYLQCGGVFSQMTYYAVF